MVTPEARAYDSDIQLLALNAGTNKVPDLVPDASLAQPAIRTPLTARASQRHRASKAAEAAYHRGRRTAQC